MVVTLDPIVSIQFTARPTVDVPKLKLEEWALRALQLYSHPAASLGLSRLLV